MLPKIISVPQKLLINPSFSSESVSHLVEETSFCSSYCPSICSLAFPAKILTNSTVFIQFLRGAISFCLGESSEAVICAPWMGLPAMGHLPTPSRYSCAHFNYCTLHILQTVDLSLFGQLVPVKYFSSSNIPLLWPLFKDRGNIHVILMLESSTWRDSRVFPIL